MNLEFSLLKYFDVNQIYVKVRNYNEVLESILLIREKFSRNFINVVRQKSGLRLSELLKIFTLTELENVITKIKIGRFGKFSKLNLHFTIDEHWLYISELLRTDGHISKNFDRVKLVNNDQTLLNKFDKFVEKLGIIYIDKKRDRHLVYNKTLSLILNKIFEIPNGNKSLIVSIPQWYKKLSKKMLSYVLRGSFDGDGTVQFSKRKNQHKTRRIRLTTGSLQYSKDIQNLLKKFNIESKTFHDPRKNRNVWYVEIQGKLNVLLFKNEINFFQSSRKKKLYELVKSYKNYTIKEFKELLKQIHGSNENLTVGKIGKLLKRSGSLVSDQLDKLESKGELKTKVLGNKRILIWVK